MCPYLLKSVSINCFTVQINEFVKLGGDQLVPYYADILGAILPCISDKEEKIRVVSLFTMNLLFVSSIWYFHLP